MNGLADRGGLQMELDGLESSALADVAYEPGKQRKNYTATAVAAPRGRAQPLGLIPAAFGLRVDSDANRRRPLALLRVV